MLPSCSASHPLMGRDGVAAGGTRRARRGHYVLPFRFKVGGRAIPENKPFFAL